MAGCGAVRPGRSYQPNPGRAARRDYGDGCCARIDSTDGAPPGLAIGPRAAVSHATRHANLIPNPNPNPNPNQVASPLCALAFTRMLSAPQFIFVAAAGPVLLALLLLASLRRTTLRPYRDEACAGPILVADPRRRLLLVGGESDMVPASPCAAAAQAEPGPTPSPSTAAARQQGEI